MRAKIPLFFVFLVVLAFFQPLNHVYGLKTLYIVAHTEINGVFIPPYLIKSMVDKLKIVKGINLIIYVRDNTTTAIDWAISNLTLYLEALKDYKIIVQPCYLFEKYGYYIAPFWKYPLSCFSEDFYNEWYGRLVEVFEDYPNVIGIIGYNEPFHHFEDPNDALTLCMREYTIWKNKTNLVFSTEINMPHTFWREKWNELPIGSVKEHGEPLWADFSDYIGINLWVDEYPPSFGTDPNYMQRYEDSLAICTYYSEKFNKPILVAEFPVWHIDLVADLWGRSFLILYKLWDWETGEECEDYSLFVIDEN
ncbi:MAG: hypothetical protein DRN49_01670, partial [Thaumarchaeota archaeon]